jgi:hypothetical protein
MSHGADSRNFREGERIPFSMFVRNASNEVRFISVTNDFDSDVVDLTDSDGKSIPVQKSEWYPSLHEGRFHSCFCEMLEPGEVMAFRQSGLGLALPKSPKTETTLGSFGPAADRPNWLAPKAGKYSLKPSNAIQFGTTSDRSNLCDVSLSTGSIQFELIENK